MDKLVEEMARAAAPLISDKFWHCECTANRGDDCDCGDAMLDERSDRYDEDLCRDDVRGYVRAALAALIREVPALGNGALEALAKGEAVVVPRKAAADAVTGGASSIRGQGFTGDSYRLARDVYRAMLSASPYRSESDE